MQLWVGSHKMNCRLASYVGRIDTNARWVWYEGSSIRSSSVPMKAFDIYVHIIVSVSRGVLVLRKVQVHTLCVWLKWPIN